MKNDLVKNLNRVTFSDDEAVIYTDEVGNRQVLSLRIIKRDYLNWSDTYYSII